ncbi:MAG: flagellar basal body L-ring protein FlgH [Alphaproteobacteria bacterium]
MFDNLPARTLLRMAGAAGLVLMLAGCGAATRISEIGQAPEMTPITSPTLEPGYQPVALPMPAPEPVERQAASLWRPGSRAFFRDQRAGRVGDILTVLIEIDDSAAINNSSSRSRTSAEDATLDALFGYEADLNDVFPETVDASDLARFGSTSGTSGSGTVDRGEQISLRVAALVTQVLPNGTLVIQGRQEVRVNFELRELIMSGVIRPEDIRADNTVKYDQIAEARISYGGRGQITDVQQPRYGEQLFDIIMPF